MKEIFLVRERANVSKGASNLLPVCAGCEKVRDERGYWRHIETNIEEYSSAEVTHGICPECMEKQLSPH